MASFRKNSSRLLKIVVRGILLASIVLLANYAAPAQVISPNLCGRTITADVVAFDQIIFYNRFGSFDPGGMMYALRRDVVPITPNTALTAGNVQLRGDKRPRPIVLRVNEGDCLQVKFTNYLNPSRQNVENLDFINAPDRRPYYDRQPFFGNDFEQIDGSTRSIRPRPPLLPGVRVMEFDNQGGRGQEIDDGEVHLRKDNTPATRNASIHINGLDYTSIQSDGANVGKNVSSLVPPNGVITYTWYAGKKGQYLLYSMGAHMGGEGDGGQPDHGLFGMVNVEPANSKWYRSQVTKPELDLATIGTTTLGQPKIDYEKKKADGVTPVLNILKGTEIIYTDLNAIITNFGLAEDDCFAPLTHQRVDPPSGTCGQPFREFSVLFHDELETGAPAFPELLADESVFHSVRDGFGINYGASGLGAELLANRKKIGPAKNCDECVYEEFFLESFVNGDPALLVKYNASGQAIQALFPDDPSNVHHSYIGDPVRFRNVHAGPKETHVFHLHAHQWLQSPRDQNSTYLDSQTISPGAAFTYEIQFGGSGNRNFTPGDAIFHCHLYPHFAQGMWELWRNHDVFENGTQGLGFPGRNLPDGEIAIGVPTPALVPMPNLPMALMPTASFQGFPFYIAGDAGHRPSQPPFALERNGGLKRHKVLSAVTEEGLDAIPNDRKADPIYQRVKSRNNDPNLTNFARELIKATVQFLDPTGTPAEKTAMDFHAGLFPGGTPVTTQYDWPAIGYPSFTPLGAAGKFLVNGRPKVAGAPYADPCPPTYQPDVDLGARRPVPLRNYRTAWIQFDTEDNGPNGFKTLTINRAGWHDRQGRITVLEDDALAMLNGTMQPDPLFFRANSGDCIDYRVTNLVPGALNLDDFMVYQGTDIIGQHIHLVKFDVTSSDGAGNGWNYESGAFSPETVQERIRAIRAQNNCLGIDAGDLRDTTDTCPIAVSNPKFGDGPHGKWKGAQTLIERWWADPIMNRTTGNPITSHDRTLRTVFTHDHFSPSGHQHHGLYAGLVIEPTDAKWFFINGTAMGGPVGGPNSGQFPLRPDGGPTNFAANIISAPPLDTFREYMLEIGDFAIVYTPVSEGLKPVNPPNRVEKPLPIAVGFPQDDPAAKPFPEAISAADPGTQVINYKNEPIGLRLAARDQFGNYQLKPGNKGDPAFVFSSVVHFDPITKGDPFTPLLKAYPGDRVQIRVLQGAQEEQHAITVHAHRWFFEPGTPHDLNSANNSGYTNSDVIGISEHVEFDMLDKVAPIFVKSGIADVLYSSAPVDNLWDGMWGILRAYRRIRDDLAPIPQFGNASAAIGEDIIVPPSPFRDAPDDPDDGKEIDVPDSDAQPDPFVDPVKPPEDVNAAGADAPKGGIVAGAGNNGINKCPTTPNSPPIRNITIEAWLAKDLLGGLPNGFKGIRYNENFDFFDSAGIVYINAVDRPAIRAGQKKLEPLVIRVNSGQCLQVKLRNHMRDNMPEYDSWNHLPPILNEFNFNQVRTSSRIGLHPQVLAYDVSGSDGSAVGVNPVTLVRPGHSIRYAWYAGTISWQGQTPSFAPAEFGVTHLRDYGDVIKHASHGAIGSLVVEPAGTDFKDVATGALTNSGAQVDVFIPNQPGIVFREFVVNYQDDVTMKDKDGNAMKNIGGTDDSEDSGQKAFNYRTEPTWSRVGLPPQTDLQTLNDIDWTNILSSKVGNAGCSPTPANPFCDPATPLFKAVVGMNVRFRVLEAAGHPRQHGFTVFGHHWQFEPWTNNSRTLGNNPYTFEIGSYSGIGPTRHFNILIKAGGQAGVAGDFLYRTQESFMFSGGLWGIFRVESATTP